MKTAMHTLRACEHCTSHCRISGQLYCLDPIVRGPASAVLCETARQRTGGCGWDASRLDWPAIGVRSRVTPARVVTLRVAA